jgi:hypothetical protein
VSWSNPGDFDQDTDVDGEDFVVWQRGVGGEFDAQDLADWRANFGAAAVAAVQAVPEPAALSLALPAASIHCLRRIGRRRKSN